MSTWMDYLRVRSGDDRPGCTFEGVTTPWSSVVDESVSRAMIAHNAMRGDRRPRMAFLRFNSPEYLFWLCASVVSGASLLGIDPVWSPSEMEEVLGLSPANLVVSDDEGFRCLKGLGLEVAPECRIDVGSAHFLELLEENSGTRLDMDDPPTDEHGLAIAQVGRGMSPGVIELSSAQSTRAASDIVDLCGITATDVCYCPTPLSREIAVLGCWGPAVMTGAEMLVPGKFSAERFVDDVREFNCTYFTFSDSMISDILARPVSSSDTDNRLRVGFGTGASDSQRHQFEERFGCTLLDAESSSYLATPSS